MRAEVPALGCHSRAMYVIERYCGEDGPPRCENSTLVLSGALMGLTALAHPWTWSWLVFCLGIYVVATASTNIVPRESPTWKADTRAIITVVAISILIDLAKSITFGSREGLLLSSQVEGSGTGS